MNSRQLAELVVARSWDGWTVKHIAWDGTITDTEEDALEWLDTGHYVAFKVGFKSVPIVEQIINLIVQRWTVGAGGCRQHTESVNNFAVYVGDRTGIRFAYEPDGTLWISSSGN